MLTLKSTFKMLTKSTLGFVDYILIPKNVDFKINNLNVDFKVNISNVDRSTFFWPVHLLHKCPMMSICWAFLVQLACLQSCKYYLPHSALASHVMVKKKDVCHNKQNIICRSCLVNAGQSTVAALHKVLGQGR
jgi:hypothetical protein